MLGVVYVYHAGFSLCLCALRSLIQFGRGCQCNFTDIQTVSLCNNIQTVHFHIIIRVSVLKNCFHYYVVCHLFICIANEREKVVTNRGNQHQQQPHNCFLTNAQIRIQLQCLTPMEIAPGSTFSTVVHCTFRPGSLELKIVNDDDAAAPFGISLMMLVVLCTR